MFLLRSAALSVITGIAIGVCCAQSTPEYGNPGQGGFMTVRQRPGTNSTYDSFGRLVGIRAAGGSQIRLTYDQLGRVASISSTDGVKKNPTSAGFDLLLSRVPNLYSLFWKREGK